jgi:hypothetical protein
MQLFPMKEELRRLLIVRLLLWKRAKSQKNIEALQQLVKAYVSVCGGWKRAFPSDICGDVYVDTSFNIAAEAPWWISENLRLPAADIDRTRRALGIPELVITRNRDKCPGFIAFCMVLYKLSAPRRLCDLRDKFGGTKQRCGRIVNHVICFLFLRFRSKMAGLDLQRMNDAYMQELCSVHFQKNQVMENIWGFIDGTVRPCCRPVRFQEALYNGHKKTHAIKFQSVVAWDGIICHLNGPWVGCRHDSGVYAESGLQQLLESTGHVAFHAAVTPMALYADQGYALNPRLFCPYPDGRVDARHMAFNKTMSQSRITVEWSYGRIIALWKALNFKESLKIFKSPIGAYYMVAALLTNCVTCLEGGNAITDYANGKAPSLEEYLSTLSE